MSLVEAYVPLAVANRSGQDESLHHGAVVGVRPNGEVAFAAGDPTVSIYPRSSNKPLQAVAMVRAGLSLPSNLLALVCASHDGTARHVAGAREILAAAGLDESALRNTSALPLQVDAAELVLRSGGGPTPILMNCSGKHAGMLNTCVTNGWDREAYLDPTHPLQLTIDDELPSMTGEELSYVGIDGCGAPAHMMSLVAAARAFQRIANGQAGAAGTAVYRAMTGHPEMVGGPARGVTVLMQQIPGLMAKDGAEGVLVAALGDGRAVAMKIADGAERARNCVLLEALRMFGVETGGAEPLLREVIRGHGQPVGTVRSIAQFEIY